MTFELFLEYLGFVAVLYIAAEVSLEGFWKPFVLHPVKATLQGWHKNAYTVAVKTALFVSGLLAAGPMVDQLDIFSRWPGVPEWVGQYGLTYTPWAGAVISVLLMTIAGEYIHDFLKEHDINLPMVVRKPNA